MEQGGRPLEMEVAAEFMDSTPTVEQGTFYTDAESGKPREIDVVSLYTSLYTEIASPYRFS
jgi:hypothetical protein